MCVSVSIKERLRQGKAAVGERGSGGRGVGAANKL